MPIEPCTDCPTCGLPDTARRSAYGTDRAKVLAMRRAVAARRHGGRMRAYGPLCADCCACLPPGHALLPHLDAWGFAPARP